MRVAVTGATGYLGAHTALALLEAMTPTAAMARGGGAIPRNWSHSLVLRCRPWWVGVLRACVQVSPPIAQRIFALASSSRGRRARGGREPWRAMVMHMHAWAHPIGRWSPTQPTAPCGHFLGVEKI